MSYKDDNLEEFMLPEEIENRETAIEEEEEIILSSDEDTGINYDNYNDEDEMF